MNIKYYCEAGNETGYHAHSKAFWNRLQKFNDGNGIPINIVLETSNHPIFYKEYSGIKICYNVYESTLQPEHFFKHILNKWDYFWCPSSWQRDVTIAQGFPAERVMVVPEGVDVKEFFPISNNNLADIFTFIIIGKWEYRKATEEMINCWLEEFPIEEFPNVKLILSVDNPFDWKNVDLKLQQLISIGDPRIEILHFPPRDYYVKLLQTSHVFLSCSRSEGWNLPLIEAIACGIPTICTNYSAQLDYATDISHMVQIKNLRSIPTGFPGEYAEPDFNHFKSLMKYVYQNWESCRKRALNGSEIVRSLFTWERSVNIAYEYLSRIEQECHKLKNHVSNKCTDDISVSFIDGATVNITGDSGIEYNVNFIDNSNNRTIYTTKLRPLELDKTYWAKPNAKYFIDWKIEVLSKDDKQINLDSSNTIIIKGENLINTTPQRFVHNLDLKDKRVFISLESKALGDNLAWLPYVEEFTKKWGCKTIVSTFWNILYEHEYPNLKFVKPGTVVDDIYAQYKIGCFDNDRSRNKFPWREIPLQKIASDILGLQFTELTPRVSVVSNFRKTGRKYVCISDHSTMQAKFWNLEGGWQSVIDYLNEIGYDVIAVSKNPTGLTKLLPINDKPIEHIADIISKSDFFIGVGSGLSWLSWALGKKVIMISGFSDSFTEFQSNNYRISAPSGSCHGCFNDSSLPFTRDWDWCPRNKNYECSRNITFEMVKEKIDLLISHL